MPKLAVFPKAYMHALCKSGSMKLAEWIRLAGTLEVEGLEWYAGFLEMEDRSQWEVFRESVESNGQVIPMLCCSPDFTHPDANFRAREIDKQKYWIEMANVLGAGYCRVLSGQRRPGLSESHGLELAANSIMECLETAREKDMVLILENHYKDDFWEYPEFAQYTDVFCKLLDRIQHPNFGVNFDPSNAFLAGENPLDLLERVAQRIVTMHASDRYLTHGTPDDLRNEESGSLGYAARLRHGEIGKGLNDYDAIFTRLKREGFDGWISVEDGVEGFEQLERSVAFLRRKVAEYWPEV